MVSKKEIINIKLSKREAQELYGILHCKIDSTLIDDNKVLNKIYCLLISYLYLDKRNI